jgi:ribonucleoside-triphosphate reductase (formate)
MIGHIEEILEFQKAFMKVCSKIRHYKLMTFPVLTFSLLFKDDKFVDETFARWCSDHNCLWMDSNFFTDGDVTSLSSCCRLINDSSKLKGFSNSIGGTALKIGSVKVNTINLMRIAYESDCDKDKYMRILTDRVRLCIKALDCIRHIIYRNIEKKFLPNYQTGIIDLNRQFNTIGINAMFGYASYSQEGLEFATAIMDKINEIKDSYTFSYSINVEAVPAERCAVILCKKDEILYPDETRETIIYSNQWIPLTQRCSMQEKIKLGSILDKKCGGGQISHINVDAPFISDENDTEGKERAWKLLNYIAKSGVIYFAFNSKISACKHKHGFYGHICPKCGEESVDTWQRIVGFLTPASSYSKERKTEFNHRKWFNISELREL